MRFNYNFLPIAFFSKTMEGGSWLTLYFLANLALTIYNKIVMQFIGFRYPWMLTCLHAACRHVSQKQAFDFRFEFSTLGCFLAVYPFQMFTPSHLGKHEQIVMLAFSLLYTVNIVRQSHLLKSTNSH